MATSTSILNNKNIQTAQKAVEEATSDYQNSQFSVSGNTANYQKQLNNLGEYQSQYGNRINDTLSNIEKGYDMNSDKLYQQYKQQYTREGLNASRDVSGQVASLNGGADSSMGRRQAAQAYYNYMQALNDKVPELANQWQQNQYNYLSALQSLDESDYNKYANNRDYYKDMFQWSYNNDVNMFQLEQEKLYNILAQKNTNFSNTMSLAEFQAQMNQDAKQFGMEYALKKAESKANVANTKANTENTKANTAAIKASLNQTSGNSTSGTASQSANGKSTTGKPKAGNKDKPKTGNKASEKYLSLAKSIVSYVDQGKTKDFKSKIDKAYKNGKITEKEKNSLLNTLNKASALNSQKKASNYKDAKTYVNSLINSHGGGSNKKQYAVNEIETRYKNGKITQKEYDKLIKYIDKNM